MSIYQPKLPIEESERRLGERLIACLTELSDNSPDNFEDKQYAALADGLKKAAQELYKCEELARDLAWRTRLNRNNLNFKSGD